MEKRSHLIEYLENSMEQSAKGTINSADIKKWIKNISIFFAPLALIYISSVVSVINESGFSWSVFEPSMLVIGAMALYLLNAFTDLIKKFLKGN